MSERRPDASTGTAAHGARLLELYDSAIADVYGYLVRRCGNRTIAEDLTADTFTSAVDSIRRQVVEEVTVAWLVGIARHKLLDHWRGVDRERRRLAAVADELADEPDQEPDDADARLDALLARDVLARLSGDHRAALSLRYLDGLPVAHVARLLDRSEHATEALLVRARRAFRREYASEEEGR